MILTAENLVKTFPGVRAVDGASLRLQAGSVHALLGENGAGKSTMAKLLTGVYQPDGGRIKLDGVEQHFVVDEPTVGIDVRTKAAFHELIAGLATDGLALLLISSDLPETIALADRIAVTSELRIVGELANDHDYPRMSQQIIRLIHAEVHAA